MGDVPQQPLRTEQGLPETDSKYKTLGRRMWAAMFDSAILFSFGIVVELLLLFVDVKYRYPTEACVTMPIGILYPIVLTKLFGGTIGKLCFNVTVTPVKTDLGLSWFQSILRELINIVIAVVDFAPVLFYYGVMALTDYKGYIAYKAGNTIFQIAQTLLAVVFLVEIVSALASKQRRSIHDLIAGTVVTIVGPYRYGVRTWTVLWLAAALTISVLLFGQMHS